ncbi:sensor histidine kinase [Mizugakiibacter sediminis]|uniref:histidine kinase n=1 Tax=Mizugakiibacter sediminis TaxID=1475481 RepID=A0A0K8QNN9_9GAMM|nr:sensor histidine kinase [Mizugakiibacter sediminis]GAP66499.1 sensor histidine kinase [Mizugakiibacter sediminis]
MASADAPSLRRRLLLLLAPPLFLILAIGALVAYGLALRYAGRVYDRWLLDSARALQRLAQSGAARNELNPQARLLIEFDSEDRSLFAVRSLRHGLLSGNAELPTPAALPAGADRAVFDDIRIGRHAMRMATVAFAADEPGDRIVVSVAETLHKRQQLTREILLGTLPIELALVLLALGVVWLSIGRGLRLLDPLVAQVGARHPRDLAPLDTAGVPVEVLPLTRTIDVLLMRLREMVRLQERFIADAAHQLRTPLAGLRLQAERALADPRPETVREALGHVVRLAEGAGRAAGQLLALARTQAHEPALLAAAPLDLAALARDCVAERVPEALAQQIDLGYLGPDGGVPLRGDAVLLREMLCNLVDNAMRYGRDGGQVTVGVEADADAATLWVEDDGPGVPAELQARLGERFFRVPGTLREGSGLGLAIVREIAAHHGGRVRFGNGSGGRGLRVEVRLPTSPGV